MSFREAFTKSRETLVDYDDNASLYFFGTMVLVVLVPLFTSFFKGVVGAITGSSTLRTRSAKTGATYRYCQCNECKECYVKLKKEGRKRYFKSSWFRLQFVGVLLFGALAAYLIYNLSGSKDIQSFDPFETLNVSRGATDKVIRRAYRTASLKYHPDKNPNDPTAQAKFIMISKAYQALTDETAKRNYELYGNPDGPGALRVGIGLPSFIVDEENHQLILVLFLVLFIFLLPLAFIVYYRQTSLYYPNGILVETVHLFGCLMTGNTVGTVALELLALSAESAQQPCTKEELQAVKEKVQPLIKPYKEMSLGNKLAAECPSVERNYILLSAHLQKLEIPPECQEPLRELLLLAPAMTQTMIEIAAVNNWSTTVRYLIDLRRCLVQGCGFGTSPLAQIPHVDKDMVEKLNENSIVNMVDLHSKEKARTACFEDLSPERQADINAFLEHVSQLGVHLKLEVLGEETIAAGDLVTATLALERRNLKEGEAVGPVHAPRFPGLKHEEWWAFLGGHRSQNLVSYCSVRDDGKHMEEVMQFYAPSNPGSYLFELILMCDSYAGVDLIVHVRFQVVSQQEAGRDIIIHPDDEALDEQPSLFTTMFGSNPQDDEDEEDETESEKEDAKAKAGKKERENQPPVKMGPVIEEVTA